MPREDSAHCFQTQEILLQQYLRIPEIKHKYCICWITDCQLLFHYGEWKNWHWSPWTQQKIKIYFLHYQYRQTLNLRHSWEANVCRTFKSNMTLSKKINHQWFKTTFHSFLSGYFISSHRICACSVANGKFLCIRLEAVRSD